MFLYVQSMQHTWPVPNKMCENCWFYQAMVYAQFIQKTFGGHFAHLTFANDNLIL